MVVQAHSKPARSRRPRPGCILRRLVSSSSSDFRFHCMALDILEPDRQRVVGPGMIPPRNLVSLAPLEGRLKVPRATSGRWFPRHVPGLLLAALACALLEWVSSPLVAMESHPWCITDKKWKSSTEHVLRARAMCNQERRFRGGQSLRYDNYITFESNVLDRSEMLNLIRFQSQR